MSKNNNTEVNDRIVLSKPYVFEGETYTELDLQSLNELTGKDLIEIDRVFISGGGNPILSGLTMDYALIVANRITKKPLEFFYNLPAKDGMALRDAVFLFLHGED